MARGQPEKSHVGLQSYGDRLTRIQRTDSRAQRGTGMIGALSPPGVFSRRGTGEKTCSRTPRDSIGSFHYEKVSQKLFPCVEARGKTIGRARIPQTSCTP